MWSAVLDFVFPRSPLKGTEGKLTTLEELTRERTDPVLLEERELRALGLTSVDRIVAAAEYGKSPLLKQTIHRFKYMKVRSLHMPLAEVLLTALPLLVLNDDTVLCAVPLHWTRKFSRGFNQSALLARVVGERASIPVADLLKRTRPTGQQMKRGRVARFSAMTSAFRCTVSPVPAHVILVDDLSTTGATLDACAKALKSAGVERVEGLVVAHG